VAGFSVDGRKFLGKHNEITAGIDGQYNNVRSVANTRDIITNATTALDTRYPDGGSNMTLGAVYAQHLWKLIPGKLVVNDGMRLSYTQLNAKFNTKEFFPFPFSDATQQNTAVSGNLGIAYMPGNRWRIAFGSSTGFRSPNVDDLAKVFESAGALSVIVPNSNLKPEYTYNAEINISHTGNIASWGASIFYTWFNNAIVVSKYKWNGQDNILYQNILSAVYAPQNQASAKLYGFNLNGKIKLFYNALLQGTYTYTKGTYNNGITSMPLDHIPPAYGRIGLKKGGDKFNVEGFILFNGWKRIRDYNLNGEDNEIYATADGMPSWMTVNFSSYYTPNKKLSLGVQIENIADKNYRYFASGISAVGRNFIVSCRLSF
jgi:hemoglobin/transferrin/lactoferrin receptor protein